MLKKDEISEYLEENIRCENLLEYWSQASRFPTLQRIAKFIHAHQVASAESERLFSVASKTITHQRSSMKPDTFIACMKMKKSLEKIKVYK